MLTGPWHLVMRLGPVFFPALSSGMGQLLQQLQVRYRLLRQCHKPIKTCQARDGEADGTGFCMAVVRAWYFTDVPWLTGNQSL